MSAAQGRGWHHLFFGAGLGCLLGLVGCAGVGSATRATPATPPPAAEQKVEAPAEPRVRGSEAFQAGVEAFGEGAFDVAEQHFQQALREGAPAASTGFNLALSLERQDRAEEAVAAYRTVLTQAPEHRESLLNLGALLTAAERHEEAQTLYTQALEQEALSRDADLLSQLSTTQRLLGASQEAEMSARRVLERHGDHPGAYLNLALIHLDRGHLHLARYFVDQAGTLAEEHPAIANTLGLLLLAEGEPAAAIQQFEAALQHDASYAPAQVNLGALALRYRDYAAAETAFQKAVELSPGSVEAHRYLAWALDGQQEEPAKALAAGQAYEKVLSLAGDDREALCGAAWAYAAHREGHAKAGELLTRCRELPQTEPVERARIDAKLQAMATLARASAPDAQAQTPPAEGSIEEGAAPAEEAPHDAMGGSGTPGEETGAEADPEGDSARPATPDAGVGGAGEGQEPSLNTGGADADAPASDDPLAPGH